MVGYIGRQAVNGNFIKLDSITTSATTTFNLLNGGVAYSPESARNCIVSLNGVIQSPETAYNIVGSTIVFSETLASQDVIDHIIVLGDVNALGTVSDGTVTASKLGTDAVITAKVQNDAITTDKINLVSTSSTPSLEAKGDGGSQDGYIQLNCSQNSHGIKIKSAPHSANASYTLTLPNNDGNADQFLKTDGSGVLSFADAGGGGKILQVVSATDGTTRGTTSTTFVTASNTCTLNITPSATSSKILLMFSSIGQMSTQTGHMSYVTIYKDGSNLIGNEGMSGVGNYNGGNTSGYIFGSCDIKYIDSPNTTSQLTYAIYLRSETNSYTARIGAGGTGNTDSTLIAMEIGV